jgi:hypothetical protein
MKKLYRLLLLLSFTTPSLFAQTTYTWNVASGDWGTPASWTPARNTPANNDILVFNGSVTASPLATNVPKQTIGKLRLINNVNVRLVAGARIAGTGTITRSTNTVTGTGTLFTSELMVGDVVFHGTNTYTGEVSSISSNTSFTVSGTGTVASTNFSYSPNLNIGDGSSTALDITAGSTLTLGLSGAEGLVLRVLTGSKASISGTVRMLYTRNRVTGVDSASILIQPGALIKTDSSFSGNAFGLVGNANTVIFLSGSGYEHLAGANPFALSAPDSKIYFDKGSNFFQNSNLIPSISGRSFGNFVFNTASITATQNNTMSIDSLIILQGQYTITSSGNTSLNHIVVNNGGTFNLNATGGNVNITGNTTIAASGKINLNGKFTTTPANVNFNGTSQQKISGTGSLRIATTADSIVHFRIQNTSGVLLEKDLDLNAAILDLDSGMLLLNSNTVTIGSNTLQGRATMNSGIITGTGVITRWYTTTSTEAGDSALFPVGNNGSLFPLWVSGTPSSGGTVSLTSFNANALSTNFTTPFYDTATSAGVTVTARFGHAWALSTGNGLAGSAFNLRLRAAVAANQVTDVTGMRVTLANGIAPGSLSEDGSGTVLNPTAGKIGMTAANLSNTFYLGANSTVNPLPVTFINVAAQHTEKGNVVSWSTASESNLTRIEIEKSAGNEEFRTAGIVRATNTRSVKQYSFLDMEGGAAAYRIKAVNYDGSYEYSRIVQVTSERVKNTSTLYPNPAANYIQLETETNYRTIKLYNSIGKEMTFTIETNSINIHDLTPGIYYLHLSDGNSTEIIKFVKQQ